MAEDFPRLLVATEFPPNAAGGGPAVVRQMLAGWPAEKISWWSCLPESDRRFGQKVAAHSVALIPNKFYPHNRWRAPKSWLLENVWTPWATNHFRKTLRALKPDVVWVIPHGWVIPPLAQVLPRGKIGFHVTVQDYMDIDGIRVRFGAARSQRLAKLADRLYAGATTRDATSHPMMADLRVRTGAVAAQMLHAGLEDEDFAFLKTKPENRPGEIRIAYAGTIIVEDVFSIFVRALEQIRPRLAAPVILEFFGDHSYRTREWFDPAWMREHGNLPAPELALALKKCTWGFSPMSLDDDNPRYNRFSFPTKFISYLAAGLPVITLGHPESSVVKMAMAHEVGVCSTRADVAALGAQLLAALSEPNPGLKYREGILRCASAGFDARQMRRKLYESFRECSQRTVLG